jgi:hypothetical protein
LGKQNFIARSTLKIKKISYKKKQWRPPSKKRRKEGKKNLSPRKRKACHSTSTHQHVAY